MMVGKENSSDRQVGMMFFWSAALSIAGSLCISLKLAGYVMLALAGFTFLLCIQSAGKAAKQEKQRRARPYHPEPEEN